MRVVLADDAVLVRAGIARVLEAEGFDVVGQAGNTTELLALVARERPQVAIVDVRMPPTHTDEGIRAAEQLRVRHPDVGVLILSQHAAPPQAFRLLTGLAAGIGYLLKERVADVSELADAVRRVGSGGVAVDSDVVARLIAGSGAPERFEHLTGREGEILALMAEGRSNQAIASTLFLGVKTVETHIKSIFGKLGLVQAPDDHRRVLAVLTHLRSRG
jgi:DNA-binding NarL/FixJ family response regulator